MTATQPQDPLEFLKGMWGQMGFPLPGMVTPTLDTNELDKRIADLKAVEGWLRTNMNLLQMTIQGLEMQRATLAALHAMSQSSSESEPAPDASSNPFANPALWPWNLMPQGDTAESSAPPPPPESETTAEKPVKPKGRKKPSS